MSFQPIVTCVYPLAIATATPGSNAVGRKRPRAALNRKLTTDLRSRFWPRWRRPKTAAHRGAGRASALSPFVFTFPRRQLASSTNPGTRVYGMDSVEPRGPNGCVHVTVNLRSSDHAIRVQRWHVGH